MVWIYTETAPRVVETAMHLGMRQRTVNYNITPLGVGEEKGEEGYRYKHQSVRLEAGIWSYDAIVSAIVSAKYPHDKMDAVVNNYLSDPTDDEFVREMKEMQDWRRESKRIATEALRHVEDEENK